MPANTAVERILSAQEKDSSKTLGISLNGKAITTKEYIPKAEAQNPPTISYAVPDPSATYMVVSLDPDAPFASVPILGPILHWIQPGFKAGPDNVLASSEPFVVNYIAPAPPPGSGPHRYVFILFEQPKAFDGSHFAPADGQPLGNWGRIRWDLDEWQEKANLGEPLAVNYFTSN